MKTLLFVGGGTLGHIIPAVAVAREWMKQHPDAAVHFVCSPRGEAAFLEKENLPHTMLDAPRLSWNFPWKFFLAYQKSRVLLQSLKPDLVFSKGGYVAVPVCLAAKRMKIPIILHESDAVMGRANRLIARIATHVCLGFPKEMRNSEFRIPNSAFTGNPIRPEITRGSRAEGLRLTGFSGSRPILLIMGGSQGAQAINGWTWRNLEELTKVCDVIHLTGPGKGPMANGQGPSSDTKNRSDCALGPWPLCPSARYYPLEFAHTKFPHIYACTDLAVSRAGAGSIAELAANGIASILIPLRGVAHDHQQANAVSLLEREAALLVTQNDMDNMLLNVVKQLINDPSAREKLRRQIQGLSTGDSTGQIVKIISLALVERAGA